MTAMPVVSLFNGFGGAASLLLGWATLAGMSLITLKTESAFTCYTLFFTILVGALRSLARW